MHVAGVAPQNVRNSSASHGAEVGSDFIVTVHGDVLRAFSAHALHQLAEARLGLRIAPLAGTFLMGILLSVGRIERRQASGSKDASHPNSQQLWDFTQESVCQRPRAGPARSPLSWNNQLEEENSMRQGSKRDFLKAASVGAVAATVSGVTRAATQDDKGVEKKVNPAGRPIKAICFDAYGTLFDVYSVAQLVEKNFSGKGAQVANIWREKQLQYSFLRTMADQYKSFWEITQDALTYAGKAAKVDITPEQRRELLEAYFHLQAFPENLAALKELKAMGVRLAVLSNGSPDMLNAAVKSAGMEGVFEHVLSVHPIRKHKIVAEVYDLGPKAFQLSRHDIGFVSSNGWDITGATWYGFHTFWANRAAAPTEELDAPPIAEGRNLTDLVAYVRKVNHVK